MSILRKAKATLLLLTLAGCSTPLRAPLCRPGEAQLPPGASGRYRYSSFGTDLRYSDAYAGLEEMYLTLKEQPHGYEAWTSRASVARVRRAFGQRSQAAVETSPDVPAEAIAGFTVCRIGDAYYAQQEQDDGTFTVSRFDLSATQITATPLVFIYDELVGHGFRGVFVPKLTGYDDGQKRWEFDFAQKTRLIVDNAGLADASSGADGRERLMTLAHPVAMGVVFTRVGPAPKTGRPGEALVFRTGTP